MKNLFSLVFMLMAAVVLSSCGDDEDPLAPGVSGTDTSAEPGGSAVEVTFAITAEGGYASSTVEVTDGTAVVASEPAVGDESGNVVVSFTPPTGTGSVDVTVTVTDEDGALGSGIATVSVSLTGQTFTVSNNITSDVTWVGGNTYVLDGRIAVVSGATLTIEAGTLIKGEEGDGANASALIIARGARIKANGTANSPIIFTSVSDEIQPGSISSPNLDENDIGEWGGLLVLGNAPISADAAAVQIEGIPADDTNGLYGGNDAADDSGTLNYISIRHGGANIGEGNEINGLTLGGVGNGTTITNIEVVANQDDGIECFGGTVNITNALVWAQGDDAYDIDQAYSGTIDNYVYIAGEESDHGLEIDGPEGSGTGSFTMQNGSLKGLSAEMADFRDGAVGTVQDSYFFNFSDSGDIELDAGDNDDENATSANYVSGDLVLTGLEFNTTQTIADIVEDKFAANNAAFETQMATDNSIVTTPTVGADASVFGWTFASASGELSDF